MGSVDARIERLYDQLEDSTLDDAEITTIKAKISFLRSEGGKS